MKSALAALALAAALLTGCGKEETAAPAATPAAEVPAAAPTAGTASAPAAATPVAQPASDAPTAPAADAQGTPTAETAPAAAEAAPAASTAATPAPEATPTPPAAPVAAADIRPPSGPEPVEGQDYERIDPPAPMAQAPGKIEVAEVFAYYCIHCATMQKLVTPWKATLPADVDLKYVPMAHGQAEAFARAFYAADAMGILDATHEAMFDAVAVQRKLKTGQADEIVELYGSLGQDAKSLESTMQSFAVNAQIARAQKAITRWAIDSTPTFVVAGKYKVTSNARGQRGVFEVVEHLVARERAAMGTNATP